MATERIPTHSKEELNAVAMAAQGGDAKAATLLAEMMRPYVIKLVRNYDTLGDYTRDQQDEIKQAAWVGVWIALEKFDPGKGTKFNTYAWYWARHEVHEYMSKNSRSLPLSRRAWQASKQLEEAWAIEHPHRPLSDATAEELQALDIDIPHTQALIAAKHAPVEMDPEFDSEDASTVENVVFDAYDKTVEDAALNALTAIQGLLADGDEEGAESVAWSFVSDEGLDDEIAENLLAAAKL